MLDLHNECPLMAGGCWYNGIYSLNNTMQSRVSSLQQKIVYVHSVQHVYSTLTVMYIAKQSMIKQTKTAEVRNYGIQPKQSPRFKNFGSCRNSLNPTLRPNLRPNSDDSLCHGIDSCKIFSSTFMKIKPTLVGFSGEGSMLSLVLIKTQNAPIPTMKIRQIEY